MVRTNHQLNSLDIRMAPEGEGGQPDHGVPANVLILLRNFPSDTAAGTGGDDHDGGAHGWLVSSGLERTLDSSR